MMTEKTPTPTLADRVKAVETALHSTGSLIAAEVLANAFARTRPKNFAEILETRVTLGRARKAGEKFSR